MKIHTIHHHHNYELGEPALSCDIDATHSVPDAEVAAYLLNPDDAAFISHDGIWKYAIVAEVAQDIHPYITFIVGPEGSTKQIDRAHWSDEVRPVDVGKKPKFFKRYARINPMCHYTHHPDPRSFQERQESCLKHLQSTGYLHNPFVVGH